MSAPDLNDIAKRLEQAVAADNLDWAADVSRELTLAVAALALLVDAPPTSIVSIALEQAGFSPCRSKRGAVVFRVDVFRSDEVHVHGRGHNHKPTGDCDGSEACKATCRQTAVHAEQYALLNAGVSADGSDLLHVKSVDGQLVPSGGPSCLQCSKLALASGIAAVWLYHEDCWRRYPIDEFHRLSLIAEAPPAVSALAALPGELHKPTLERAIEVVRSQINGFDPYAPERAEGANEALTDAIRALEELRDESPKP